MFTICGPKCSICCTIISIWGIIQLSIMGGLFFQNSIALSEDLGVDTDDLSNITHYMQEVGDAYENQAYKCWIAVAVYIATLMFSLCQLYINKKRSYET